MEFQTVYNVLLGIATAIIGFLGGFVIKSFQRSIDDVNTRTRHIEVMVAQDYMSAADFKAFRTELKEDHREFRTELITAIAQMRAEIKSDNLRLQNQIQSKADK